jgi:hypothetical protein
MNAMTVETVKMSSLPAAEVEAIRQAEAEAEAFYQAITDEETERLRLADLRKICNLMWNNRDNAATLVTEHLSQTDNFFTATEKATLITVAGNINPDNTNHQEAIKALKFVTTTSRLYRTMRSGYYIDNLPATELLKRYESK